MSIRFFESKNKSKFIGMKDSVGCVIKNGDLIAQENSFPVINSYGKTEVRFWHVINWYNSEKHLIGKNYSWYEARYSK